MIHKKTSKSAFVADLLVKIMKYLYGRDVEKGNFKFSLIPKGIEPLSVGKYRVSKGIDVDGEKSRVYAEFEIVEHLDISAGEGAVESSIPLKS